MIDSKIGECIPSKIIRAGKAWHGLVEFVGYSSPRCPIDSMMITTRGGKRIPYPAPKNKLGKSFVVAGVSPIACVYMHSSAKMEVEDEDGMDWSGYVIAQLSYLGTDKHRLLGLRNSDFLFMTPDGGGQAIPYVIDRGGLRFSVYSRINMSHSGSLVSSVSSDDFNKAVRPVGAALDGRSVFFAFVSSSVLDGYSDSDPPEDSIINKVDVSGDIVNGVSSVIASSPYEVKSEQHSYTTASSHYHLRSELDYSGDDDDGVPAIITVESDVSPSRPWWFNIVGGYDNKTERFSVSTFPYLDGAEQPQFIRSTRSYVSNTVYDGKHTARAAGDGYPPEAVAIVSGHTDATLAERLTLSFDAGALNICTIAITADLKTKSEMEMYTRYNLNSVMVTPSRWVTETVSISLSLDGTVIFSKPGYYWYDDLRNPPSPTYSWWPPTPSQELPTPELNLYRIYRALSLGGARAAEIEVRLNNYFSRDIFSIAVVIREGDVIPDNSDGIRVAPGTVTQTMHFGKCFARGVILDDPITLDESEFGGRLYRAFDPIDRVITPVYKWPVFFQ